MREDRMDKKRLLGLILFAMIIITGLFVSTNYLINKNSSNAQYNDGATAIEDTSSINSDKDQKDPVGMANEEENPIIPSDTMGDIEDADKDIPKDFVSKKNELNIPDNNGSVGLDLEQSEPWLSSNPTDIGNGIESTTSVPKSSSNSETNVNNSLGVNEVNTSVSNRVSAPELIYDCTTVDYMSYVPAIMSDSTLEQVLNIKNPNIDIDAEAAILIDTETKEVLYHKNPIEAEFPASTAKLLTALVALEWCTEEEDVTIGDEISMIASDSTRAYLLKGRYLQFEIFWRVCCFHQVMTQLMQLPPMLVKNLKMILVSPRKKRLLGSLI
jgi:D-alanyl-D-alanine carboxypeptidase (penicillin-binding protein 5/6)